MICGVHHVAIHALDIERTRRFYEEAFGFRHAMPNYLEWQDNSDIDRTIRVEGSAARMLMMSAGNCYLELFEFKKPEPPEKDPLRANDRGNTHIAFAVANLESEMHRLKAIGMTFVSEMPQSNRWLRAVYGRDPDGNLIELIEVAEHMSFAFEKVPLLGSNAAADQTSRNLEQPYEL